MEQNEEIVSEAALFASGNLDPDKSARLESMLAGTGAATAAELATLTETAATIALTAPPVAPPPVLRDRLMARIAAENSAAPAMRVVAASESGWMPGPAPGVEYRSLHGRKTMLVRIAAGATVPAHSHRSGEHCLMLEGTMTDGETTVGPGDFVFMPTGSTHHDLVSEAGCTFLVMYE